MLFYKQHDCVIQLIKKSEMTSTIVPYKLICQCRTPPKHCSAMVHIVCPHHTEIQSSSESTSATTIVFPGGTRTIALLQANTIFLGIACCEPHTLDCIICMARHCAIVIACRKITPPCYQWPYPYRALPAAIHLFQQSVAGADLVAALCVHIEGPTHIISQVRERPIPCII